MAVLAEFNRSRLTLRTCSQRGHELKVERVERPGECVGTNWHEECGPLVRSVLTARREDCPVIMMIGGHVIKLGLSRYVVDLIERGLVTHVATNGSGIIHDFELAAFGGTSENVSRWIRAGQFGLWAETGRLNDVIADGARRGEGLGEAVGRVIEEERFPNRDVSIAAACHRCRIPITCHVTIGADIIHAHPNCDGAALGATSYRDFLIFARSVQDLEGGVFLNIGTAVTGPEVFLKALSMARNVAHQDGKEIRHFMTAVFDLVPLPANASDAEPAKDDPLYYFRPWKTLLVRTVADGGKSLYFCGDHRETIPTLWHLLTSRISDDCRAVGQAETGTEHTRKGLP